MRRKPPVVLAILFGTALNVHCGGGTPTAPTATSGPGAPVTPAAPQPTYTVSTFVSGMAALDGTTATQQPGSAPTVSGGPSSTPSGNAGAVVGGSNQFRVQSGSTFRTVNVFVEGVTGGVGGFWQLRLPVATADTSVVVTYGTQIPVANFDLVFSVASESGAVGAFGRIPTQRLSAASGEVQISVSWDALSDVDLHVVDPNGTEIYYDSPSSSSGGQLDLDSNAGCVIDGKNNENIRWTRAPGGTYTVRVDYWDSCGVSRTNYLVTVRRSNAVQTFTGSFSGGGDKGEGGSGVTITSFSHVAPLLTSAFDVAVEPILRPPLRGKARR